MSHRRQHGNQKAESRLAALRRIAGPRNSQLATRNSSPGPRNSQLATRNSSPGPRNSQLATRNSPPDRRGILLLVVLSMLVLFLLVGTSFVVTSNQYRKANKTLGKPYTPAKSPLQHADLLEEVVNQLVRDTNNEFSSLRYHSLLRDLYGSDGFAFELPNVDNGLGTTVVDYAPFTGNQFIRVDMTFTNPPPVLLSQINGYYNGLLWTMADGAAGGQSVRIVNYRYFPPTELYRFDLMRPENLSTLPVSGSRVVINGRPFNGTGVGYNPVVATGARLSAEEDVFDVNAKDFLPRPIALMPNAAFFDPNNVVTPGYFVDPNNRELSYVGQGGSDESYDAPDFQNMALAWSPVSPIETVLPVLSAPPPPSLGNMVLPSFHRPALINYWANLPSVSLQTEPNLLRKVMLRPNWFDHPEFTGSNPDLADSVSSFRTALENNNTTDIEANSRDLLARMIYGPWDVDNDNDGRRDSVWVDFGAPVMMSPQGKLVKPLAAILCLDMDGRLNLNAHGTVEHLKKLKLPNVNFKSEDELPNPQTLANGVSSDSLAIGQGYGPAEISLQPVLSVNAPRASNNDSQFDELLYYGRIYEDAYDNSSSSRIWSGRYGSINEGIWPTEPGFYDSYDLMAQLKQQGMPQWANNTGGLSERLGNYATPPDLRGRYSVGLNDFGQPVYEAAIDTMNLDQDSPYELDLSRVGPNAAGDRAKDGPFSLAEMERILRAFDRDAGKLPPRLWELANRFRTATSNGLTDIEELNEWRALLTTDSFDLPVPSVVLPEWMRTGIPGQPGTGFVTVMGRQPVNLSFADLLEYRVRIGLGLPSPPAPLSAVQRADLQRVMSQLLAPELADGLRLDLNRPFGNGRDDNTDPSELGYGVVDEPGEFEEAYWRFATGMNRQDSLSTSDAAMRFDGTSTSDPNAGNFRDNFDRNGNGVIGSSDPNDRFATAVERDNFRRQLFARHLYVLAMTLVDPVPDTASQEDRGKRARQLAQWAINVADFRDPDNIMTAFEYDANPFDGWQVDGDLGTPLDIYGTDGKFGGTGANADPGGLVWGAERPELVITETLAWHDRRTRDSRFEGEASTLEADNQKVEDVTTGDLSADQQQRPQGAAFIELYNPWPAETAANADTHKIDPLGNDLGIDLARTHDGTLANPTGVGSPVWRIMVYRDGGIDKNPDALDTNDRPGNFVRRDKKADRSIYFTGSDPNYSDDGVAFFNDRITNLVDSVRPGRYMVIGSGIETDLSTGKPQSGTGEYLAKFGENNSQISSRGILLRPMASGNQLAVALTKNSSDPTASVQDFDGFFVEADPNMTSVALINQAEPTADYSVALNGRVRRFTFTEPAGGYPDSVDVVGGKAFSNSRFDPTKGNNGEYVPMLDIPLDDVLSRQFQPRVNLGQRRVRSPINDGELRLALPENDQGPRTIPGFNWIYLQRLANPLMPWNPAPGEQGHVLNQAVNPYMTIDSMGVNVTVFNGLSDAERRARPGTSPLRFSNNYSLQSFASNQRGRLNDPTKNVQDFTSLQQRVQLGKPIPLKDPDAAAATNPFKNNIWTTEPIDASSYWMNKSGPNGNGTDNAPGHYLRGVPDCTLGFMNEPFRATGPGAQRDLPETPFPWIAWNNRPYVSAGELLQVPKYSMAELPRAFAFASTATGLENYVQEPKKVSSASSEDFELDGPYPHLMNFFRTGTEGINPSSKGIVGLYRVLDYVGVPSRYVGTETWLNPAEFGDTNVTTTDDPRYLRQPPFNKVSGYRDPGRVNLNTVVDARVWDGGVLNRDLLNPNNPYDPVLNTYRRTTGHSGPPFDDPNSPNLTTSRRGYGTPFQPTLQLNSNFPTFFANPHRSSSAGDMVPLDDLKASGLDCTLMRSSKGTLGAGADPNGPPLFYSERVATTDTRYAAIDTERNAYFRYQPMTRLSELTTTRSNVYAVWITVGFFEVEEAPSRGEFADRNGFGTSATPESDALYDRVYPEGYQLGREMGSDTGEFDRLREFAIVDRSIPVAFEPGEDHNVERAVRLRRRIE